MLFKSIPPCICHPAKHSTSWRDTANLKYRKEGIIFLKLHLRQREGTTLTFMVLARIIVPTFLTPSRDYHREFLQGWRKYGGIWTRGFWLGGDAM